MSHPLAQRLSRVVPHLLRRRAAVLGGAALVTLVGGVYSARLYSDLRSGLEELLPESAPAVVAARKVRPLLHSTARLAVVLEGVDGDALERFADDLAARLRRLPRSLVESVELRTTEQEAFVDRFGPLYLDAGDLTSLRDDLRRRTALANPLAVDLEEDDATPAAAAGASAPLDLSSLADRAGGGLRATAKFRNGYYQTPDGRLLVLQVWPPESSTGLAENERLVDAVEAEVAALGPEKYDPELRVGYSGEVAELVEQQGALVRDLASTTALVLLFVLGALWLYFRRWAAIAALCGSLLTGCAATFGLGWLLVGHLNANTAFLGSIVFGNGINVGIVYLARYLELRRALRPVPDALQEAWAATLPSTFVAAFASGLAYLSLAATDFRGFSQFGLLGGLGMALCWLSAYLLLPPLLSAIEGRWPIDARAPGGRLFERLSRLTTSHPIPFLGGAVILLVAVGGAVASYRGDLLETDLARMGARSSVEGGAIFWGAKANEVLQASRTPIVLRADSPADLRRALAALQARRDALGAADPLRLVLSLETLLPAAQPEKLELLAQVRALLPDAALARLSPADRARAAAFRDAPAPRAVTFDDLPAALRRALSERDGTVGRIALLFPAKVGRLDLRELQAVKSLVRAAIADAGAPVATLSALFLLSDIDDVIVRDAPKATLLALLLVCGLVAAVLRSLRAAALVLSALGFGVLLLVGAAAAAGVRANFLNFVALPITFGIGVDYAVNIVVRFRDERSRGASVVQAAQAAVRETGSAVALCSATTVIGYGSLVVADSQALAGFGALAAVGELTCLAAALFLLPAFLCRKGQPRPERLERSPPVLSSQAANGAPHRASASGVAP